MTVAPTRRRDLNVRAGELGRATKVGTFDPVDDDISSAGFSTV